MSTVETEPYRMERRFSCTGSDRAFGSIAEIPGRRSLDRAALPVFLRLGYVPGTRTLWEGVSCLPGGCSVAIAPDGWKVLHKRRLAQELERDRWAGASWDELVREGGERFVGAVADAVRDGATPIVPLSGGLDSRAVLGALREIVESWRIETVTYGTEGGLDFEIGNRVGRHAGTRHLALDLRELPINRDRLVRTAKMTDANTDLFQPVVWTRMLEIYGSDAVFWTGYTGDGVGGSFFRPDGPESASVAAFLETESRHLHWAPREDWDDGRDGAFVDADSKWRGAMSSDEAVWFENHVERYTAHHIFVHGARYRSPFMDDRFVRFMLSIPPEHRRDKRLFDAILTARFPDLFRLPTRGYGFKLANRPLADAGWRARVAARKVTARLSSGRWATHPDTNYIDYADGIRRRPELRTAVRDGIDALARRDILDPGRIRRLWDEHEGGRDHRFTLTILASLEYMMQALVDA